MTKSNTLNPGNEPDFYIAHEQLPDTQIADIKISPDGQYLAVTGCNSLSYIYRRNPNSQVDGFYKLDWSCQHPRLSKSVVNFIDFGKSERAHKYIICPVSESMIYQYEIFNDDKIEFCSALDISKFGYHCIHWFVCYTVECKNILNSNATAKDSLSNTSLRSKESYDNLSIGGATIDYFEHNMKIRMFIIGSHPIDNKNTNILTPMAEYYASVLIIVPGYNKLFNVKHFSHHKDIKPKPHTKRIFVNEHEHCVYLCSYDYNGVKKYSRSMYNLSDGKHYNSYNESQDAIILDYPDDHLYFKDNHNQTQKINYYEHDGIQYKNKSLTKTHQGYEISEVKTLGENYIIQEVNDTENILHWGDSKYNYTHIKTYKDSEPISIVNLFTLDQYERYIIIHEKDKNTKTLRLGFIQFISDEIKKHALQKHRLLDVISHATVGLQTCLIPPELVDIIQSFL